MQHPLTIPDSESQVIGRRIGATLVDAVIVFFILYLGMFTYSGTNPTGVLSVISWDPHVVLGFFFWFVFSVMIFVPLLYLHGFSSKWYFIVIGIWATYATFFEAVFGWTIGKRLFGISVVNVDGSPVTIKNACIRNISRIIDGLLGYGVGLGILALSERYQRLGDLLADTIVAQINSENTSSHD